MKMRVMMLGVTGLILSGCFFANDEIKCGVVLVLS